MTKEKKVPELRFPGFIGEWKEKKLGEIAKVYDGIHQTPVYTDEGVPFISVENIEDISKTVKYISEEEYNKNYVERDKEIEKDNILMTRIGSIGQTYLVTDNDKYGYYVTLALIKNIDKNIDVKFLNYTINSDYVQNNIYKKTLHVAYPKKINLGEINFIKFNHPEYKEQVKIGNLFFIIDQKLDLQKKKIEELKIYKKGLMQRIFDQEIRFKDEDGQDYPDWEEKRLGELGEFLTSSVNKKIKRNEEIVNLYNYMDVYNKISINNNNLYKLRVTSATKTQLENNNLLKGDILITPSSETPEDIGHSVVIKENLQKTVYSYHLIRFRPNITTDILFSNYWFNNESVRKEFIVRSQGATRFTLSINNIKKVKVKYPCNAEQKKIGLVLSAIDKKIELEEERLELYEELKKGLMKKMFV